MKNHTNSTWAQRTATLESQLRRHSDSHHILSQKRRRKSCLRPKAIKIKTILDQRKLRWNRKEKEKPQKGTPTRKNVHTKTNRSSPSSDRADKPGIPNGRDRTLCIPKPTDSVKPLPRLDMDMNTHRQA